MEHSQKIIAIQFIRPNSEFVLSGDDLEWFDKKQTKPTESEIENGWIAYQQKIKQDELKKKQLLEKLGITEDEAKLLLA